MNTALRHGAGWLLAVAFAAAGLPALAQQGSPEDRARVLAQLDDAAAVVQAARAAAAASQARLAPARENLEAADRARLEAERQLKASEAGAARGRLTRDQVNADRALAEKASAAVAAVRGELAAVESELAANQAKLATANAAVEAASAAATAWLGETEAR